jgi:putative transposase
MKNNNSYISDCHRKYYLKVHLIFVCKYRKKLLDNVISSCIKKKILEIANNSGFSIDTMETDNDHIHILINYVPNISITSIVRKLKQETTVFLWKNFSYYLSKHF